ncbi:MAG: hypothetical protein FJX67_15505 [Alphaproteobacteria bacterium]|nr:hypothetical protein [Alphaproteobacteria bacterium]
MASLTARQAPMSGDEIKRKVIPALALALVHFARRGVTHRAIRPDNIFFSTSANASVLLGDCVATPPSWNQPAVFEPIEVAQIPPAARGAGTISDDLYALGATILSLSLGYCPLIGQDDREVVALKTAQGSYAVMLGGERPPVGLREVVRGLLADDFADRWTLADLEQWLTGELQRTVPPVRELKVDRSFDFAGKPHRHFRTIAQAFGEEWEAAATPIRNRTLEAWLKRCNADHRLVESIATIAVQAAVDAQRTPANDGRLVAHVAAILDPSGPLRYRGLIARPDGLGVVLASAMWNHDARLVDLLGDTIAKGLALDWYRFRERPYRNDDESAIRQFRKLQQFLRFTGPGYGIERCLYELNPHLECQSPVIEAASVMQAAEILPALEVVVAAKGQLPTLLDRHLIAFIAARRKRNAERELGLIQGAKNNALDAKLAVLDLFAQLQEDYGPDALPALAKWIASEVGGAATRFASRTLREQAKRRLEAAAEDGRLGPLAAAIADDTLVRHDMEGRARAAREYAAAAERIALLESQTFEAAAQRLGWSIAAGVSSLVAVTTFAAVLVL